MRDRRRPPPRLLPQPEGVPGSVGAVDHIARARARGDRQFLAAVGAPHRRHWLDPEEPLEAAPVEAHDDLVVHHDDRHRHSSGSGEQLVTGRQVLGDVLCGERDAMRRKKLFRRVARLSGRGPVDRYCSVRGDEPPLRSPPKTRRASLNASPTVAPAPGAPGFASLHARRCSSDRKKLSVVQSESRTLPRSSAIFSTHTMTPSASGAGASGPAEKSRGVLQS